MKHAVLFLAQCWLNGLYHCLSASNEKTLGTAEKIIIPPATKRHKINEYNNGNAWVTDFPWRRHEDKVNTRKSGVSVWPSFCRLHCARVEAGFGEKEEEVWHLLRWGWGGGGCTLLLLGPGNVDCTGWLRVGTGICFYGWYRVPVVSTV